MSQMQYATYVKRLLRAAARLPSPLPHSPQAQYPWQTEGPMVVSASGGVGLARGEKGLYDEPA